MEYTEITMKVPKGHEDSIKKLVLLRIEGIIAHELLQPTQAKKDEFDGEVDKSYRDNNVEKPKKTISK